jgi:hypothetical protein
MFKTTKIIAAFASIVLLSSFNGADLTNHTGTYGVSESDPSQIKLIIHADQTFYYQDFSVPDKKIIVSGTWTQREKKVILDDSASETNFHSVWTFKENGQVAKSRNGMAFYRLCRKD